MTSSSYQSEISSMTWGIILLLVEACAFFSRPDHGDPFRCQKTQLWVGIHHRISDGFRLIESGELENARAHLNDASRIALANLTEAFECSLGITALYRALAHAYARDSELEQTNPPGFRRANQVALRMMHVAMNWLTHAFVIGGKNDGKWVDQSSWPITIQEINDEESLIQRRIRELGPQGHLPTWPECPKDYRDPGLRIGVVTMCDYPADNPLPTYSMSNKHLYAAIWNYTIIAEHTRDDVDRPHAWGKIRLLQKYGQTKEHDWLLWFDCDTYFMNFNQTLDSILYTYGSIVGDGGIRGLDPDINMIIQEDHAMLNTGVFFIRPGIWTDRLLKNVYGPPLSPWINHPWWENAAFSHEFLGQLYDRASRVNFTRSRLGEDDMDGVYPPGIKVIPQTVMNSYHPITSRLVMHDNYEVGKFVLAFSGCTSGSSPTVVKFLYGNYYRLMCEINRIGDKCIPVEELL